MVDTVEFSTDVGGDGTVITNDRNASTGIKGGGHVYRFVKALGQMVAVCQYTVAQCQLAISAAASALTYKNAAEEAANTLIENGEVTTNKVTSISGASTNTQYPSAKLLYDQLALKFDADATTDDVAEGVTNLFFSGARAIAATLTSFTAGAGTVASSDTILQALQKIVGNLAAWRVPTGGTTGQALVKNSGTDNDVGWATVSSGLSSTDGLSEGATNLYFTNARVIASVLTGFTSGAGTVASTDTILQAIQKIVGNISGFLGGSTGSTDNALLRANGTGGATAQASAVIVGDDGQISGYKGNAVTFNGTTATLDATSVPSGSYVRFTNSSAVAATIASSVPANWCCSCVQIGAGQVTFSVSGGTLNNYSTHTKTAGQKAIVTLYCDSNADSAPQIYLAGTTA